ncbi:MAG: homocysteine S-methyltransferase family protein [Synergistaceae bacterium]|jgi:5-methyltetrahydrofolate--homocysteine methyltransferase|nr:homocysteine S-methyltransferase family protein [Synergistaceae bacterium]
MISRGEFRRLMEERTLLLDGSYGTSFFEMGFGGVPAELLNLKHPEAVEGLHRAYVEAGCDILLANTFGGNRFKLEENSLDAMIREIHTEAVRIARKAANAAGGRRILVFGDIASTGRLPRPSGDGTFDECRRVYAEQASLLLEAGCDGLIVETMTDIKELKAALIAIRETSPDAPLIAHMAFDASGTTLTGASIDVFAAVANDLEVDVLGMNCLVGPAETLQNLRKLAALTDKFLSVEPNAGNPHFDGHRTTFETDAATFGLYVEEFVEAGASVIGGCCGTTPDHIRTMAAMLKGVPPASRRPRGVSLRPLLASRTSVHDLGAGFTIIGERINPTGKKRLRDSMRAGDFGPMLDEAAAQAREGAHVLDVNFGVEKFFSKERISDAFVALDRATSLPISLDVQSVDLMETALAEYPGRPLINSSACDEASLSKKLPLLKKYGGVMVLLAMESEISNDPGERVSAVERAVEFAGKMGLGRDRFMIDALVLSRGAGFDHNVTLETIRICAKKGFQTTAGLSNLSHGLPNRSGLNAAFLSLAVDAGLSAAIINSGDNVVMETLFGATMLKTGKMEETISDEDLDPLVAALLSGRSKVVKAMVDERLAGGMPPIEASQSFLGDAMERVGDLYEAKKIFLPHILFAAETAFPLFDQLNAMMAGTAASRGRVLIATVEGDIHDIGKNIVGTVLRAGGFEVIDMGKSVTSKEIVARVLECSPDIVGLSAMMTTTVGRVSEVTESLKDAGLRVAVISGGASMNSELADLYGVRYAENSSGALALCKELTGEVCK